MKPRGQAKRGPRATPTLTLYFEVSTSQLVGHELQAINGSLGYSLTLSCKTGRTHTYFEAQHILAPLELVGKQDRAAAHTRTSKFNIS